MVCAVDHDPLVAVVRHSTIRDIDTVIINGVVRKENGHLLPIDVSSQKALGGNSVLQWSDVAKHLSQSRKDIQVRVEKCDVEVARKALIGMWHIDPNAFEPVSWGSSFLIYP
jgi:hypothetical protein